jgi:serine/threonine-protein kinase RsbT
VENEVRIPINADQDIVTARQQGRTMSAKLGFNGSDLTVIATAVSEVARNIVEFAGKGEIILTPIQHGPKKGIMVVARDDGPGIPNIQLALQDGFSTTASLGLGLPGSRRLMDEFTIVSAIGKGTTVTMRKWMR